MKVYDIGNGFKETSSRWEPGENYYWIICDAAEIKNLLNKLVLDPETLEECMNINQSPKISFYDSYVFVVFNLLEYMKDEIISRELNIYLGRDYIITIYKGEAEIIDALLKDIRELRNCFILRENPRPCILFYYILDRIIVRNYNVISMLEAEADQIEIDILKRPSEEHAHRLITLRRQVFKVRKFLNPLRYIGDSLTINDNGIIEEVNLKYFESLNRKIDKLMKAQEILVQDLALVREAFESEIANKTNGLMKIFTTVAVIFLPLELITGLFGMSFSHMPFKDEIYGFYAILIFMLITVIYLARIFKRNKWL
ncbi:MAG: magnesium transporter CorA family protein [Bacillota bacterium]|nr:magnesium transporter CorA family protein [Bacillota bacterium]